MSAVSHIVLEVHRKSSRQCSQRRSPIWGFFLFCARREFDDEDEGSIDMCKDCGEEIVVDEDGSEEDGAIIPVHCACFNGKHTLFS